MLIRLKRARPFSVQWRHNEHDGVSNHQPHNCLLKCLFRCWSKQTSTLRVTGLREGNSPVTGEFPAQRASNAENVSIWWRHHVLALTGYRVSNPRKWSPSDITVSENHKSQMISRNLDMLACTHSLWITLELSNDIRGLNKSINLVFNLARKSCSFSMPWKITCLERLHGQCSLCTCFAVVLYLAHDLWLFIHADIKVYTC